ncbi:MAG: RNA 2',3'-cyclic phosphodiesterase [Betaproteobacteria bacterium]|nr:MAG: RNA 2',3'-cyclic phosphodiesterase [Betaproteobacteria bacterium]
MSEAAETVRLFFALWPANALQEKLAIWARQAADRGRAMRRENIHLTLAFLGATEASLIPSLTAHALSVRFGPIRLPLDRVGYWKHNRIIWCGAGEEPQALVALVDALRTRLDAGGIHYDHKPFVSHITLVRNAHGLPAVPAWIPLVWQAHDFALVSSTRVEGRVSYAVLQRFPAAAD